MRSFLFLALLLSSPFLFGQTFTKITNSPTTAESPTGGYAGVSWIDYDGDDDLDLFVNRDFLFQNDGSGNFTRITNSGILGSSVGLNNGNSWADYDNDGDLDLVLVNQSNNGVFRNNGDGTFSRITTGDIAINLNAWSAAWADYDNDGWLDLVAIHPCGFIGACQTNWLFKNNQDGSFTEITNTDVNMGLAAYTVANWADFDDDGDMDLFIGSGEVNFTSRDHIYINQLSETGTPDLNRQQSGVLFGDTRDGQNWNLIDYDNDGDLDAFVTNYRQSVPNDFYKNNGDGSFTRRTDDDLGVHMVSEAGTWLANTWGDFNNDGWIDVFISADLGSPVGNHMYLNHGDGTFEHHFPSFANQVGSRAAANGDYDNDGDLDLYINASQANFRGLYRNNLDPGENENWINISLEGTQSNRSAVGATVRIKARINGEQLWQRRDISTQNAFCGQNSMRLHFGLGDATTIDSLLIEWPRGLKEVYTDVASNQFVKYKEGLTTSTTEIAKGAEGLEVFPNPSSKVAIVRYQIDDPKQQHQLRILDTTQKVVFSHTIGKQARGQYELEVNTTQWPAGTYYLILEGGTAVQSGMMIVLQ